MATCPSCGKENPDGFAFCGFCAASLTEAVADDVTRRGEHDIHDRIKEIGEVLKGWSASGGGLLALSREDVRNRDEEWLARQRERAEERRREAGGSDA